MCAFVKACKEGNVEAVERLLSNSDFQSVYNGIVAAFDNKQRYYTIGFFSYNVVLPLKI